MRLTGLFALFLVIGTALANVTHHESLVGTWRLVSYEDKPEQGPSAFPFGEKPKGLLIYDSVGNLSIQIMKTPHPKVASGDEEKITADEKVALFNAYTAYFGRYRVDEDRHVVIHHVEGDLADVYIGRNEERPYTIQNEHLTLKPKWTVDGKRWEGTRVFVRVSDD
jgi:lipocalin-like protein